jgi:Skp family chaperone for outer membrane proteins
MLAALLVAVPALLAQAAPKPATPPAPAVGIIDVDAIDSDYKGFAEAQTYWGAFQEGRQNAYQEMAVGQYLTPAEFDELQLLAQQKVKTNQARFDELSALAKKNELEFIALMDKVKNNLPEADRTRLEELRAATQYTQAAGAELEKLVAQGKEKLSDEDKARLKVMEDTQAEVLGAIGDIVDKFRKEIDEEKARLFKVFNDQMEDAIGKVAKDNGLTIVFNRNLATQQGNQRLVLWGGMDITEKVLKHMNDTFKPESLAPPKAK